MRSSDCLTVLRRDAVRSFPQAPAKFNRGTLSALGGQPASPANKYMPKSLQAWSRPTTNLISNFSRSKAIRQQYLIEIGNIERRVSKGSSAIEALSSEALVLKGNEPAIRSSASSADWSFCSSNQLAQRRIDGPIVREMLGHVRREEDQVRAGLVTRGILSADAPAQLCQIVLPPQLVPLFSFLNSLAHKIFFRAWL